MMSHASKMADEGEEIAIPSSSSKKNAVVDESSEFIVAPIQPQTPYDREETLKSWYLGGYIKTR